MLAVKKERPTRGEPINIPDYMLSPQQLKRKHERRRLMNNISFYSAVFSAGWFVWFFLYQETNWKVAYIGMIASAVVTGLIIWWRRRNGFGGDGNDMDRGC